MRKKLLFKPISIVCKKQTVAQTIIDKVLVSNKGTIADIQGENYLVFKVPNGETISLLNANGTALSPISPSSLSSDQSYGRLQNEEPTNQLFTQTILPLSRNINTSTAEALFSKNPRYFMGVG